MIWKRFFGWSRLSTRLIVSHVIIVVLALSIALGISRFTFQNYLITNQMTVLQARGQQVARIMHGYFTGTLSGTTADYLIHVLQGTLNDRVYVVDNTGQVLLEAGKGTVPVVPFPAAILKYVLVDGKTYRGTLAITDHHTVTATGIPILVHKQVTGAIFMEAPLSHSSNTASTLTVLLFVGEIVAIIAAIALAYALSRRLSRPLESLRHTVSRMSEGDPTIRAIPEGPQEVDDLAREFNQLADRIDDQVKQLKKETQVREQLLAHVAHDLRTPLTSIRGFLEAIKDGVVTGERMDHAVDIAFEETLRLKRLVDRLLIATRIQAGIGKFEGILVSEWVQTTMDRVEPIAQRKSQTVQWQMQGDGVIAGVKDYLVEALINIIDNALKWTPPGGEVTIETRPYDLGMEVSVQDSGPGISPEILPRIFERFVTGDSARTDSHGLGLAIVQDIIQQHHGKIAITNREPHGTCVTLWFPMDQ